MDTHGTAAHLFTVAHDVIGIAHRVLRILVEVVDPVGARHGERMMHRSPLGMADSHIIVIRVVGRLEQREVDNPSEGELVRVQ